jgi:hypothetical protein
MLVFFCPASFPPIGLVYLDEVQDFSYAMIFLICSIGGKEELRWIFAGDTAQMISSGCSFKFAGLKQTLLAIQPGIESKLGKGSLQHLLVNYRTSKKILEVGNAVLFMAHRHYPGTIENMLPERTTKDNGIKVVLCEWEKALLVKPSFSPNQALVCSSLSHSEELTGWLGDHPFFLDSIESKGLEFEDVVVAFDLERKVWDVEERRVDSLRMLRELYVAITRAKNRLVILVKKRCEAMTIFFKEKLGCNLDFVETELALHEFEANTTTAAWLKRAHDLFQDDQFQHAAKCFNKAESRNWSSWALGLHQKEGGDRFQLQAVKTLRTAAKEFIEDFDYDHAIDIMTEILVTMKIDPVPEDIALLNCVLPKISAEHLSRPTVVKFSIIRGKWEEITVADVKNTELTSLLVGQRPNPRFQERLRMILERCTEAEMDEISLVVPAVVGDWRFKKSHYVLATRLYLTGNDPDYQKANESSNHIIDRFKNDNSVHQVEIQNIMAQWKKQAPEKRSKRMSTLLAVTVVRSPDCLAKNREFVQRCLDPKHVGKALLIFCVEQASLIHERKKRASFVRDVLHSFDPLLFAMEVLAALVHEHKSNRLKIVMWYIDKADKSNAAAYAAQHVQTWTNDELLNILKRIDFRGKRKETNVMISELRKRKLRHEAVRIALKVDEFQFALEESDIMLSSSKMAESNALKLFHVWQPFLTSRTRKLLLPYDKKKNPKQTAKHVPHFIRLFESPVEIFQGLQKFGNICLQKFGWSVILDAILQPRMVSRLNFEKVISVVRDVGQACKNGRLKCISHFEILHRRSQQDPKSVQNMDVQLTKCHSLLVATEPHSWTKFATFLLSFDCHKFATEAACLNGSKDWVSNAIDVAVLWNGASSTALHSEKNFRLCLDVGVLWNDNGAAAKLGILLKLFSNKKKNREEALGTNKGCIHLTTLIACFGHSVIKYAIVRHHEKAISKTGLYESILKMDKSLRNRLSNIKQLPPTPPTTPVVSVFRSCVISRELVAATSPTVAQTATTGKRGKKKKKRGGRAAKPIANCFGTGTKGNTDTVVTSPVSPLEIDEKAVSTKNRKKGKSNKKKQRGKKGAVQTKIVCALGKKRKLCAFLLSFCFFRLLGETASKNKAEE